MRVLDWAHMEVEDVCIHDVSFRAGVRASGRSIDRLNEPRPNHGILYLFAGSARFTDAHKKINRTAQAGDVLWIPQGACYRMEYAEEGTHFVLLNFCLTLDGELLTPCNKIEILTRGCFEGDLASALRKIEKSSTEGGTLTTFRRKELVWRVLSCLNRQANGLSAPVGDASAKIAPGVHLLQRTYLENLPIERFAAACGMSVSGFRALFHVCYGMAPVQYRNHLRIKLAEELLQDGDCTVAEVAEATGFCSESYFCRCYKKAFGKTPRQ